MKVAVGIKKGMTRVFKGDRFVPVTVVDISGCVVSYKDDNGMEFGVGKKKANKALTGKYKALGYLPMFRQYFTGSFDENLNVGDVVKPEDFTSGLKISVKAKAKGKGFAGVVKRWGFAGGPRTHGQSDRLRAPGSIGAGTDPGRVLKGKRMAGRLGGNSITLSGREIVDVEDTYLLISGPIPGNRGDKVVLIAN